MNNSSQDQGALSNRQKVDIAARIGRGEYRLEDGEVMLLHAHGCTIVRKVLEMFSKTEGGEIAAHGRLIIDLEFDETAYEEAVSFLELKYDIRLPADLEDTLTVWDCFEEASRQLSEHYIEEGICEIEERITAGKEIQESFDKACRFEGLARSAFEREHELVARSLYWQGTALVMLGKTEDAMHLFEEALEIRKRLHGPRDLQVASTLHNIGVVLDQLGKYEESEAHFREAISICDEQLGVNHPDVQLIAKNLASMLQHAGRLTEAKTILEKALEISEQSLGHEHRQTATTLASLATVLAEQGELESAEERLRESLELCSQLLGSDSLQAIAIRNNLAIVLSRKGDHEAAWPIVEQAVTACVSQLGMAHPTTIAVRNNKAVIVGKLSAGSSEEEWQELDVLVKKLSTDDPIRNAILNRQFVSLPIAA